MTVKLKKALGIALVVLLSCFAVFLCGMFCWIMSSISWLDDDLYKIFYRAESEGAIYLQENYSDEEYYVLVALFEDEGTQEAIYVPDRVNGLPVISVGTTAKAGPAKLSASTERLYLPWSAATYNITDIIGVDTVISANVSALYFKRSDSASETYVLPRITYEGMDLSPYESMCIPANVAYLFNYDEAPNEGYFFVDLYERSGKLTKPPYDPKREGYAFEGWYTDEACTDEWSFDDTITVRYDDDGNRIYEEIKLYAKWRKQS